MEQGRDFSQLYDQHEQYKALRRSESLRYQLYKIEVEQWKIPNLCAVIPPEFRYASIAEVGCATGELLAGFPSSGAHVRRFGFDISPENIGCAQQRFPGITFFDQDFRTVRLSVDLVALSDILEHVTDDLEFLKATKKLSRHLVLHVPLEKCWKHRARSYGAQDDSGHLRAYGEEDVMRLFSNAGFEVLRKRIAWFVEQPCHLEHLRLRRSTQLVSPSTMAKHFAYDSLLKIPWLRRRYFPKHFFCFARALV